jgi:hypothetical protein
MIAHPAKVIRKLIVQIGGLAIDAPGSGLPANWPNWVITHSMMNDLPVNTIVVKNTAGSVEGKVMNPSLGGPPTITHPGIQVIVRGANDDLAMAKAQAIWKALDEVRREIVTLGSETIRVDSIRMTSPVMPWSEQQEEKSAGRMISLNCTVTLTEL